MTNRHYIDLIAFHFYFTSGGELSYVNTLRLFLLLLLFDYR